MTFKELNDAEYATFRKDLLRVKGSERQTKFLGIVRNSDTFLEHMSAISTEGAVDAALAAEAMTENEYKDPPSSTEQVLYTAWSSLTPAVACRSTFWANLTIEHIRTGRIQSAYLAANGGNLAGGAERIDFVLDDTYGQEPKQIDNCVRTVLRRLGGLREVRGNRSVYVDCPFARAWWRERIATQAGGGDEEMASCVRTILRTNQTYWEKLIDRIVFRNSTFGSENIRSAFVRALAQCVETNPSSEFTSSTDLQRLCRRVTTYQGARELSILSRTELDDLMRAVITEA